VLARLTDLWALLKMLLGFVMLLGIWAIILGAIASPIESLLAKRLVPYFVGIGPTLAKDVIDIPTPGDIGPSPCHRNGLVVAFRGARVLLFCGIRKRQKESFALQTPLVSRGYAIWKEGVAHVFVKTSVAPLVILSGCAVVGLLMPLILAPTASGLTMAHYCTSGVCVLISALILRRHLQRARTDARAVLQAVVSILGAVSLGRALRPGTGLAKQGEGDASGGE